MKAVAVLDFDDEPQLVDLPDPQPGPGEVLVSMLWAAMNPIDWKAAQGAFRDTMDAEFPLVLGFDGVGRVEGLGSGADRFVVGDLVHGQFWGDTLGPGTYAERVAIAESPSHGALQRVPGGLDPRLAAAVPTAGMAAEGALEQTRCQPGQTLLILGATGGVGVLAVQLAVRNGVRVIATARPDDSAWIEALGASETVDHSADPVAAGLEGAHVDAVDAVLDLVGDPEQVTSTSHLVRDGGTVISTTFGVTDELSVQSRITAANFQLDDRPGRLRRVTDILAAGDLLIPIQDEVPLADGLSALRRLRSGGARGKTLLRIK